MTKKKQNRGGRLAAASVAPNKQAASSVVSSAEVSVEAGNGAIVVFFALMMMLAPALGVPNEEMLQDTLKSIIVSFAALGAALLFFWGLRGRRSKVRWHAVVGLPLLLMLYALGSMAWSHTYLAAVEAIRWFIFSVLVWLGLNSLSRDRLPMLAWGIHGGAVIASLWVALQFWANFALFPQGPHPASTFVNRNFFAEFAVCALPFSAWLLARARQSSQVALLAASSGLMMVAVMMTGTRSALVTLWLELLLVLPFIAWRYRSQFAFSAWDRSTRTIAVLVLLATVCGPGAIGTGDPKIAEEGRGLTALERGFKRTSSVSVNDPSLGVRMVMWKATVRVIQQRPLSGVGAGAWESEIPLYQADGEQLETDYYVHNEYLQLLAEYGLVGWLFLLGLMAYLLSATWRTLRDKGSQAQAEGPGRVIFLCSLLALLIVSNAGFPWRMASTGALFALCLAALAASDARLGIRAPWATVRLVWTPAFSRASVGISLGCLALAAYITSQAAECEQKIVRATKIALSISASGDPNNPRWNSTKAQLLELIRQGVAINRHYRKITPMVADELARWGDWKDAVWIWESVLSSRPYVVAIMANVARGYTALGDPAKATEYLERAKKIQPRAPAVRSLEVILLSRSGKEAEALDLARQALRDDIYDLDLINATFVLAWRAGDFSLADKVMNLRIANWPETRVEAYMQLADMYARAIGDPNKALAFFKLAVALAPQTQKQDLLSKIPPEYRAKLDSSDALPPAPATPQTSASKG